MAAGSPYTIRSEPHGPHWIAWIARDEAAARPEKSVIFVGETQEEAEARARAFAERVPEPSR